MAAGFFPRLWRHLGRVEPKRTLFIDLIIAEKTVKSLVVLTGVVALFWLGRRGVLFHWAMGAQEQMSVEPRVNIFRSLLNHTLIAIGFEKSLTRYLVLAVLYATVEITEAAGLFWRRKWAEYMVVVGTGLFIPAEIYAVTGDHSLFKLGLLSFNIIVVIYLIWAKKLYRLTAD